VRRSASDIARAEQAASRARTTFYPRLQLAASYTRLSPVDRPPIYIEEVGMALRNPFPQNLDVVSASATVTIGVSDFFFTVMPAYRGANGMARAARYEHAALRAKIGLEARETLYAVQRARVSHAIAQSSVALANAHVTELQALVGARIVAPAQLTRARAQIAEREMEVVRAAGAVELSEAALRRLLELPSGRALGVAEDVTRAPAPLGLDASTATRRALGRRPEIKALRALITARGEIASAHDGAQLPHLAIFGQAEVSRPNPRFIPQVAEFRGTWSAGVALTWSPNDFAAQGYEAGMADEETAQAREDLRAVEDGVSLEAVQATIAERVARESIRTATESVRAAESSYEATRTLMRAGESSSRDVLDAEADLAAARLRLANAYIDLHVARARLDHALGMDVE